MNIGKINVLPLNETTAYLVGVIIGDGHISNSFKSKNGRSYRVAIDLIDFEFISLIAQLTKTVVPTNAKVRQLKLRPNCKQTWAFAVSSKSWWYFFTKTLDVPFGKKSRRVGIPKLILQGDNSLKKEFIAGLFDTDGGFRGHTIGLTTASEVLCTGAAVLLEELGFECSVSSWVNRKYHWRYYGLRLRSGDIDRFLKEVPMKNLGKTNAIKDRFISRRCRSGLTGQKALEQL